MSSSPLFVLMALTSLLVLPGAAANASQAPPSGSIADLLLKDDFDQAEALLDKQPRTAQAVAFRGEVEFRKGNFERADALYKESLKMDGKTARAHFGLGKLAMAKMQGKEALKEIMQAVELDPKLPLYRLYASEAWGIEKNYKEQQKHLEEFLKLSSDDADRIQEAKAGLEMLKTLGTDDIAVVTAPENPAPIRFFKSLNLIFTPVMINGQGPYDFAIDTGATQTVLSEKLANEIGLKQVTSTVMHGIGGGGKIETKLYSVKELSVGEVRVKNIPVGTFSDPLLSQIADGILGTAILSDFIITVNYPGNQLELVRKRTPAPAGAEVVPVWYFSNLLLMPLEVNGQRGNYIVDTGAVTTVLSHRTAAALGIDEKTPGAKIDLGIAGIGGFEGVVLRVPNVTFKTPKNTEVFPQVVSINLGQISKMIGTEVAGVIGYDFFDEYKLTLDYFGAEIRLTK
jgi:predicted aspartyl protease